MAFLLAGCVYPQFVATKVIELTVPAAGLTGIDCASHNGDVVVTGSLEATAVALRAELSVRGHSQDEADANLHLLQVEHEVTGGTLKVRGQYDRAALANRSPSFAFTLTVPREVALTLVSHNGDLRASGTRGAVALETHNGDIVASAHASQVRAESHNGRVRLDIANDGPVDGEVTSHNGDVTVALADGVGASVTASTHNGRITPPPLLRDAQLSRRSLRCRVGDGSGKLAITTHNGDVHLR